MALMCQKVVLQLRNTLQNGALIAKLRFFTFWDFAVISQLRNEVHCAAKWHSCAKIGFAASKYPAKWSFGISQLFRSCEMRFTVLRNGTRVPKSGFAAMKSFAKWSFPYENGIFHALVVRSRFAAAKWESLCCEVALVCQNWFRSCENFRREGNWATCQFRSKVPAMEPFFPL